MKTVIERSTKGNQELTLRLLKYFLPYKRYIGISLVCMLLVAGSTAGTAWLIKPAMDKIFIAYDQRALIMVPVIYIVLTLIKGIGRYGQNMSMNFTGLSVLRSIRSQVFERLIRLPQSYFEKAEVGALMSHITHDVAIMQNSLPSCIMIVRQGLTILALLVVVFYQNWQLALWATVALPLLALPIRVFSRKLRAYGRRTADVNAEISTLVQELLSGIRVIKAFATEKSSTAKFDAENGRVMGIALRQARVSEVASPTMELISSVGIGLIIWFGGSQVLDGKMTAGEFFSFVGALVMMYDPFKSMNSAMMHLQNALAGAERVFGMLDSQTLLPEQGGDRPMAKPFRELRFADVTFAYSPQDEPALSHASLTIGAGERIALVGPSGAGKTTFVNLIPRFYDPVEGTIQINGIPAPEYDLAELRRHVAVVSQEAFLFNMSARDNIAYGRPEASQEDIEAAARAAYADAFIRELPQGYDTMLGERGTRLSGGQKQRLTIARALLKDAPLLILDEATSALDSEAESMVQKALDNLMQNRTSIVIAHRLSTILEADRILVLERGRIIASGTHEELVRTCDLYARLYKLQFKAQ